MQIFTCRLSQNTIINRCNVVKTFLLKNRSHFVEFFTCGVIIDRRVSFVFGGLESELIFTF
jgi:hypothetical protein